VREKMPITVPIAVRTAARVTVRIAARITCQTIGRGIRPQPTIASLFRVAVGAALLGMVGLATPAQEPRSIGVASDSAVPRDSAPAGVSLTLKRAVELALQNSHDIQLAKIQASLAERAALVTRAEFLPNVFAGSGAGYTYGVPETPGGRAPSIFNVTYNEQVLNEPLRGQAKELQEQFRSQKIVLDNVRGSVIVRAALAYLELAKVRHSLELLRSEQESADKILQVTKGRQGEGLELPIEITRAQLTKAQVQQRVLQLEGREDELEVFLRAQLGLPDSQAIEVSPEDLPGEAEQESSNLVAMALQNNPALRLAEADVRAKEFRLQGEKRGYLPTIELVSVYSLLANFNNYDQFFRTFQRNNYNAGVQVQMPLFSPRTKAAVGLAKVNLEAAKANLSDKRVEVTSEIRQRIRRVRERDAAREVARLELQLAHQNVAVLQSQFEEGNLNLREVERARVDENERWMLFLDATFERQQAELELLKTAGQLDKVWQ
jgi:outer membrane protein